MKKTLNVMRIWGIAALFFFFWSCVLGNDLERPLIWVTPSERLAILQKIENNTWAKELFNELKARADAVVPNSMEERREKLLALPLVWPKDGTAPTILTYPKSLPGETTQLQKLGYPRAPLDAMMKGLQDGVDCGVIYYLTGEEKYAIAAADILATFVNGLAKTPVKTNDKFNGGWIFEGDHLYEARVVGAQIPIIYDFVYSYLKKGGKVYDLASSELRSFDFEAGQKVFRTYVDLALNRGGFGSNWPVLESTSMLQNMMAIDDSKERDSLIRYFVDVDTEWQPSLQTIYKNFKIKGDIWPESIGYSKHVTTLCIFHMTLIDRIYPELKLGSRFPNIPYSITAMYNLKYPNGDLPTLGDAGRTYGVDYLAHEMALQLAISNEMDDQIKYFSDFLSSSIAKGKYDRGKLQSRNYGPSAYEIPLQLLWTREKLGGDSNVNVDPPRPRSNHLPYAGLTIQRNISKTDPQQNSLMAVVAGASFIHGHASGMDLELYGQGHVLGTDGGKGIYASPLHENYYRLFAAHNTVISNGASATQGEWVNLGMDRVEPVVLEPKAGEPGVSPNHSFARSRFRDKYNLLAPAEHQRTVALIRLNDQQGYYLDVFRAKSDTPDQYHDYLYHNVGDRLEISSEGKKLSLKADDQRFQAPSKLDWKQNNTFQHPGWHYFEHVQSSEPLTSSIEAKFTADKLGAQPVVMQVWIPAGLHTEITQVNAPKSSSASAPYDKKPLPTFLLRHKGETWSNPFVAVYESYTKESSVQSVERLMEDDIFKGVKVIAKVDGESIIQYILIQENIDDLYINKQLDIQFKGQFAILTVGEKSGLQSMYIGSGKELSYKKHKLVPNENMTAVYKALKP